MNTTLQILIAEDDYEDHFIMAETFKELGNDNAIIFVEDGIALIEYLSDKGVEGIGLVVLDLNMPRLNGTETLRVLKSNELHNKIPVIIFSTSINEIEKNNCLQLGAQDYITKPSKYYEYIDTCKRLFAICQAFNPSLTDK